MHLRACLLNSRADAGDPSKSIYFVTRALPQTYTHTQTNTHARHPHGRTRTLLLPPHHRTACARKLSTSHWPERNRGIQRYSLCTSNWLKYAQHSPARRHIVLRAGAIVTVAVVFLVESGLPCNPTYALRCVVLSSGFTACARSGSVLAPPILSVYINANMRKCMRTSQPGSAMETVYVNYNYNSVCMCMGAAHHSSKVCST